MLLREPVKLEPVITEPGELEFVGNFVKSRFRNLLLKLFGRFVGCAHYCRPRDQKKNQFLLSSYCTPCSVLSPLKSPSSPLG